LWFNRTMALVRGRVVCLAVLSVCGGCRGSQSSGSAEQSVQAEAMVPAQQPAARGVDRGVAAQALAASAVDAPAAPANFTMDCPPAWELVGDLAEAEAQWACRSESALPDGFFPNCNVMSGPAEAGAALEAYLDFADDPAEHTWVAKRLSERYQDRKRDCS
jgi:hypothetical protein